MNKEQVNALMQQGTYNGDPLHGKLIETHISWVILSKQLVFKIKKPMQYSFLDFSALAKRKFFCDRELLLNRRLTGIYLHVLPIKQQGNNWCIGQGKGKTIDYAVTMKKLQAARKMDHLLLHKKVNPTHLKALTNKIAAFHQEADITRNPFRKSRARASFNDIQCTVEWVKAQLGTSYASIINKGIRESDKFLNKHGALITKRIKEGLQRDGHGDLHSKNIFLYRNPIIFDCIEFNDEFRQIDVLSDVAFFCMDLESFQRWDLSKQFMEDYLKLFPCMNTKEEEQLFTYYKCYRANVRAKVNALRAMQTDDVAVMKKYTKEVKKYLELMDYYIAA